MTVSSDNLVNCNCNPYATSTDLHCEKCPYQNVCILILPYDEEVDKLTEELRYYQRMLNESTSYKDYLYNFIREFKDTGKHADLIKLFNNELYESIIISQPVVTTNNIPFFLIWIKGFTYNLIYEEQYGYHIREVYSLKPIHELRKGEDDYEMLRKFIINTDIRVDADDLLNILIKNIKTDCILKPEDLHEGILKDLLENYEDEPLKQILKHIREKRNQTLDTIKMAEEKVKTLSQKLQEKQTKLRKTLQKQALNEYNQQDKPTKQDKQLNNDTRQDTTPRTYTPKRKVYTRRKVTQ